MSEFLDRQLADSDQAGAEAHMSACSGCRSEFEELKGLSKMISGVGRKPLPVGFMQRLERRRQIEDRPAAAPARDYFLLPQGLTRLAAFALSSLIVVFVVMDKAKTMMQPSGRPIEGSVQTRRELSSKMKVLSEQREASSFDQAARPAKKAAPAANGAFALGGAKGLGAISGGGGGSAAGKEDAFRQTTGESVNTETLALLQKADADQPANFNRAAASAASPHDQAAVSSMDGSAAGFEKKLARARGEPISADSDLGMTKLQARRMAKVQAKEEVAVAAVSAASPLPAAAPPPTQAAQVYTNEDIAANVEEQKRKMGIVQIIPPGSQDNRLNLAMMAARGAAAGGRQIDALQAAPEAAPLWGQTPAILAGSAGKGSALTEADSKNADKLTERPGVLVGSEAAQRDLWHKYQMTAEPPAVDYTTQMLALVFATSPRTAIQISRVAPSPDRITVYYHEVPFSQDKPVSPTYQFRVIPKTDKPVVFEKLP